LKLSEVTNEKDWDRKENALKPFYIAFFAAGLALSIVYALHEYYPIQVAAISNIVPSVCAFAGFLAALQNARKYGFRLRERNYDRIWFGFTLGSLFWILAEASWAVYYFSGVAVPYPGVPDIFYIAAYFPLSLSVLLYFRSFSGALTPIRKVLSIGAIAFSVSLVMSVVIPIEFSTPKPALTTLTDLTYPAADLILLSLTILSLAIFLGGSMGKWWTILAAAIILDIIGDELFLYQVAAGTYYNGGLDDLIYVWAYLLVGLAYVVHKKEL
jgi:hypothetical protein